MYTTSGIYFSSLINITTLLCYIDNKIIIIHRDEQSEYHSDNLRRKEGLNRI